MDVRISSAALALVLLTLAGCSTLDTGHDTLVRATVMDRDYRGREFEDLIYVPSHPYAPDRIDPDTVLSGGNVSRYYAGQWETYKKLHFGGVQTTGATIGLNVRDQTASPPLSGINVLSASPSDVNKILTDDTLSASDRESLVRSLQAAYLRGPESQLQLVDRSVPVVPKKGQPYNGTVFNYYPKVTLDLSGELQTIASSDRFTLLAVAIRVVSGKARFINLTPKAADLFDYTMGQMKEDASATATLNVGSSSSHTSDDTTTPSAGATNEITNTGGFTPGGSINFAMSDELTRDLKSSLDARSAGISEDGHLLMIQLRGNDQKRIAGTYSYDVMLEEPSLPLPAPTGQFQLTVSQPADKEIMADVRIIGVVRHVARKGRLGTFKRVPEPSNDDTFSEVVAKDERVSLWHLQGFPKANQDFERPKLKVFTNSPDATFTVYDTTGRTFLARGGGTEDHIWFKEPAKTVRVVFDPVNASEKTGSDIPAPPAQLVALGSTPASIVGVYRSAAAAGGQKKKAAKAAQPAKGKK